MAVTQSLEILVPATLQSIRFARMKVAEVAHAAGARDDVIDDIRLCVSEAVTNAIVHAYAPEPASVSVSVEHSDDELTVVVADEGVGLGDFRREGDLGYGLKIIDRLTKRHEVSSAPGAGTTMRMVFGLVFPT